jgi:hypothetical protein
MMTIVDFHQDSKMILDNQMLDFQCSLDNFQKLKKRFKKITKGKTVRHLKNKIITKMLLIKINNDFEKMMFKIFQKIEYIIL